MAFGLSAMDADDELWNAFVAGFARIYRDHMDASGCNVGTPPSGNWTADGGVGPCGKDNT